MTKIRFSQFACLTVSELTEITCEIVSGMKFCALSRFSVSIEQLEYKN